MIKCPKTMILEISLLQLVKIVMLPKLIADYHARGYHILGLCAPDY